MNQAIYTRRNIEVVTFTEIPSKDTREQLTGHGFRYRSGQWVKSEPQSVVVSESDLAKTIAA